MVTEYDNGITKIHQKITGDLQIDYIKGIKYSNITNKKGIEYFTDNILQADKNENNLLPRIITLLSNLAAYMKTGHLPNLPEYTVSFEHLPIMSIYLFFASTIIYIDYIEGYSYNHLSNTHCPIIQLYKRSVPRYIQYDYHIYPHGTITIDYFPYSIRMTDRNIAMKRLQIELDDLIMNKDEVMSKKIIKYSFGIDYLVEGLQEYSDNKVYKNNTKNNRKYRKKSNFFDNN